MIDWIKYQALKGLRKVDTSVGFHLINDEYWEGKVIGCPYEVGFRIFRINNRDSISHFYRLESIGIYNIKTGLKFESLVSPSETIIKSDHQPTSLFEEADSVYNIFKGLRELWELQEKDLAKSKKNNNNQGASQVGIGKFRHLKDKRNQAATTSRSMSVPIPPNPLDFQL